ncbi:hypothetical protein EVAR_27660_1 [Eumeta japonica]|uniref:LisH domain-containing protein n=1 Tax=Eumeta variegata TaxID=151549 RepID=A0A4C1V1N8_EUMVA|nr:hypothetical protein EVAR_27660_1 [Eumeta japonica]
MKGAPPGPTTGQGSKRLPLIELKSLFFIFLVQQGYAVPEEAEAIFSNNKAKVCSRDQSPSSSACSSKRSSSAISSDGTSEHHKFRRR